MTSTRINLAVIGGFVLIGLISLVVVLAIVAGRTGATDIYYTQYSNVAGLKYGSQVFYEGYQVGQVTAITPMIGDERVQFRVDMSITHGWKIPTDSIARSTSSGLLAPQTIAINAGKNSAMLAPGDRITPGLTVDLFSTVTGAAGSVDRLTNQALVPLLSNVDKQISAIGDLLNHDIRRLIGNANITAEAAAQDVPAILRDARSASSGLAQLSSQLSSVVTPLRLSQVDHILANADQATASLAKTSATLEHLTGDNAEDLRAAVRELRLAMENLSRHSDAITQNLDTATRNLQELSRQLRNNPGLLIRNTPPRDRDPVEAGK
ncbi:MAG: MlaD family protein [Nevskia sp.]|jgi:phospholipid/cholesterol/gamma-HCH transport system substrate-binding protein|nr:MlaD family protein [Nevskia sp.]